jgi:hypothetical protein
MLHGDIHILFSFFIDLPDAMDYLQYIISR